MNLADDKYILHISKETYFIKEDQMLMSEVMPTYRNIRNTKLNIRKLMELSEKKEKELHY